MASDAQTFDRTAEDVGNIVSLEHVNVQIPDQQLSTLFYIMGLGLTRDPYQVVGITNMWINAGRCQFHLPTGKAQIVPGHTALVIPGREALLQRLEQVAKPLSDTRFAFTARDGFVEVTCPWGNTLRCYEPSPRFGLMTLGMPYVEIDVAQGTATGIAKFYATVFGAPATTDTDDRGKLAKVAIGTNQSLIFRETDRTIPEWDGYHVAVYLADFSGPYRRLLERGLISRETNQHEYRFIDIADLETGAVLTRLEHEVRSMRHPGYARPLVNRNPEAMGMAYAPGHEALPYMRPRGIT